MGHELDQVHEDICRMTRERLKNIEAEIVGAKDKAATSKKAGVEFRRLTKEKTTLLVIEEGCRHMGK